MHLQDDPDGSGSRRRFGRRRSLRSKELAELFGVPLTAEQMIRLAAQVGSDVPFFIDGRPTLVTGRGEILAPVAGSPIGHRLVIVKPDESVSTAEAYAGVAPARPESRLGDLFGLPLRQWKGRIVNDFETSVFRIHPTIAAIKERTLSGGGSLCFHVRFGICRLRNFRRADAGSTGIRRNVCISGRYDLSECEKRG